MNVERRPITPKKAGDAYCNNPISLAISGQLQFVLQWNAMAMHNKGCIQNPMGHKPDL